MSPSSQFRHHHDNNDLLHRQHQRLAVKTTNNTATPLPLKINKESHQIHKSSSSSSSSSATSSVNGPPPSKNHQRPPVIIYTHSPKIIHAQARDFMALVQKLTGLISHDTPVDTKQSVAPSPGGDDTGSSSVVTTDGSCGGGGGGGGFGSNVHQVGCSGTSLDPINNDYISDIPIFTPNSLDFLYSSSSGSFYRYPPSPMIFPPPGEPEY